jgi:uncharacterized protein YpuA (DUF1002 family)
MSNETWITTINDHYHSYIENVKKAFEAQEIDLPTMMTKLSKADSDYNKFSDQLDSFEFSLENSFDDCAFEAIYYKKI